MIHYKLVALVIIGLMPPVLAGGAAVFMFCEPWKHFKLACDRLLKNVDFG